MERHIFKFTVEAESSGEAGAGVRELADKLREVEGVIETERLKSDATTMDMGSIVQIVATSGAATGIAHGIAAWLRARRAVKMRIEWTGKSGSLKTLVENIDPETALRIIDVVSDRQA